MVIPLFFLAFILGGSALLALAFIIRPGKRRDLEQRLLLLPYPAKSHQEEASDSSKPKKNRSIPIERFLLVSRTHPWDLNVDPGLLSIGAILGGAAAFVAARNLFQVPLAFSIVAALFGAFLGLRFIVMRKRKKLENDFTAHFPDAIDSVARMLRAGLPVTSAFQLICQEAPVPVNTVFETLTGQLSLGMPLDEALRLISQRIKLPDFQFFAVAVLLQRSSGGNLLPTLETLSQLMRSRRAALARAQAATAEVRLSAYVLSSLPFFVIGALIVMSPGYLMPLFYDKRGHIILAMTVGGLLLSAFVMNRMMRSIEKP